MRATPGSESPSAVPERVRRLGGRDGRALGLATPVAPPGEAREGPLERLVVRDSEDDEW